MIASNTILGDSRATDLLEDPRHEFGKAILEKDLAACLLKTAEIHGHFCPGSAMGVMASVWGLSQLGLDSSQSDGLEELMAIVEINACFTDGVQAVSGCTLGNNALVLRDYGKHAVTFTVRGSDSGVRVRVRPDFQSQIAQAVPEFYPLLEKVIIKREGGQEAADTFKATARKAAFTILEMPFEQLLISQKVTPELPDYAPITESHICPACGEQVMASKVVKDGDNKGLCYACAKHKSGQIDGRGIVI